MAKVDKRREDLIVSYGGSKPRKNEMQSMMTSSMPLAAMFLRNKVLSWAAFFTTLQAWLNEPSTIKTDAQPAWLSVVLAVVGILSCYVDLVFPQKASLAKAVKETAEAVATATVSAS
ncbi:similar to Saccharomyces cerevisiae YPR063C ER-localized protein of unknown function [Geotrichum candidum]|uniref:Uncharacterized protein n=1 Tax=Geotrichum candidum TaxID=1173061 RepID=A0A0J9XIG4_GEOCN|nr:similar to Saccharomyces cerevisiae YPR063C ER-localized protein of unknown function [Geotrichum candidum]